MIALVPCPRLNLTQFHGVFAPNCKYRSRVVPQPPKGMIETDKPKTPMTLMKRLKRTYKKCIRPLIPYGDVPIELTCPRSGNHLMMVANRLSGSEVRNDD